MTVAELLADETRWSIGAAARDKTGLIPVDPNSPTAASWCLIGAVNRCYGRGPAGDVILGTLYSMLGYVSLGQFNDSHSHAEVLALVQRAGV